MIWIKPQGLIVLRNLFYDDLEMSDLSFTLCHVEEPKSSQPKCKKHINYVPDLPRRVSSRPRPAKLANSKVFLGFSPYCPVVAFNEATNAMYDVDFHPNSSSLVAVTLAFV